MVRLTRNTILSYVVPPLKSMKHHGPSSRSSDDSKWPLGYNEIPIQTWLDEPLTAIQLLSCGEDLVLSAKTGYLENFHRDRMAELTRSILHEEAIINRDRVDETKNSMTRRPINDARIHKKALQPSISSQVVSRDHRDQSLEIPTLEIPIFDFNIHIEIIPTLEIPTLEIPTLEIPIFDPNIHIEIIPVELSTLQMFPDPQDQPNQSTSRLTATRNEDQLGKVNIPLTSEEVERRSIKASSLETSSGEALQLKDGLLEEGKIEAMSTLQQGKASQLSYILPKSWSEQLVSLPARIPLPSGELTFCQFTGDETTVPLSRRTRDQPSSLPAVSPILQEGRGSSIQFIGGSEAFEHHIVSGIQSYSRPSHPEIASDSERHLAGYDPQVRSSLDSLGNQQPRFLETRRSEYRNSALLYNRHSHHQFLSESSRESLVTYGIASPQPGVGALSPGHPPLQVLTLDISSQFEQPPSAQFHCTQNMQGFLQAQNSTVDMYSSPEVPRRHEPSTGMQTHNILMESPRGSMTGNRNSFESGMPFGRDLAEPFSSSTLNDIDQGSGLRQENQPELPINQTDPLQYPTHFQTRQSFDSTAPNPSRSPITLGFDDGTVDPRLILQSFESNAARSDDVLSTGLALASTPSNFSRIATASSSSPFEFPAREQSHDWQFPNEFSLDPEPSRPSNFFDPENDGTRIFDT